MGINKILQMKGLEEVKKSGEQFQRYWIAVSEDLKALTEAMNENFKKTNEIMVQFNDNMEIINKNLMELNEKIK